MEYVWHNTNLQFSPNSTTHYDQPGLLSQRSSSDGQLSQPSRGRSSREDNIAVEVGGSIAVIMERPAVLHMWVGD